MAMSIALVSRTVSTLLKSGTLPITEFYLRDVLSGTHTTAILIVANIAYHFCAWRMSHAHKCLVYVLYCLLTWAYGGKLITAWKG